MVLWDYFAVLYFVIAHSAVLFISLAIYHLRILLINTITFYSFFFVQSRYGFEHDICYAPSMAACVIWLFTYWFLIKKNKILWYELVLIAADFTHQPYCLLFCLLCST